MLVREAMNWDEVSAVGILFGTTGETLFGTRELLPAYSVAAP
jgi:hypothetical protein